MKEINLKKAAKYNYHQFDNIPNEVKTDKYFIENCYKQESWETHDIPEFFKTSKYEVGYFAEIKAQKKNGSDEIELYYTESFNILLFDDKLDYPLLLKKESKTGKYYLFPVYLLVNRLEDKTNYQQRKPFLSELSEPNKIGVFSDKKIADWVNYCEAYIKALEECKKDIESKKAENESYIQSVIDSLPGCEVEKWQNQTIIVTKLFHIEFTLLDNGNFLNKRIVYTSGIQDIIKYGL